jgi:hypothetical protein
MKKQTKAMRAFKMNPIKKIVAKKVSLKNRMKKMVEDSEKE